MTKRLVFLGAGGLALLGSAAAVVGIARAQPRSFPDPSEVRLTPPSNGGTCVGCTTRQTTEPATGFRGACLFDSITYQPTLPLVCYAPNIGVKYRVGSTRVAFPAKEVARSYSTLPGSYDSYQVLATCYEPNPDGSCPQGSSAISHSCCDVGMHMVSVDGQTAEGVAFFSNAQ